MIPTYLDFDLLIERYADAYRACVVRSPSGEASTKFQLPFTRDQLQIFILTARSIGARRTVRRIASPELKRIKDFGGQLFEAVFDRDVLSCFRRSLDEAERQEAGLRIRLRLSDPDGREELSLYDIPWEFMYDSMGTGFICLSSRSPLVRYADLPQRIETLGVRPPLRILVMISSPRDAPRLNIEQEWRKVEDALDLPVRRGLLAIERLERPTLEQLQRRLRRGDYHVFHFIGHGAYDDRSGEGLLLLEDDRGRSDPVSSEFLRSLFQNHRTLRLAVLNACEGARTDPTDPFAGVAQSLVKGGVSAVIAMQFEISDEAAIELASEFYAALADQYPVDAALAEARTGIYTRVNAVEWAVPVLYLRTPDGSIFDVASTDFSADEATGPSPEIREDVPEPLPPPPPPPPPVDQERSMRAGKPFPRSGGSDTLEPGKHQVEASAVVSFERPRQIGGRWATIYLEVDDRRLAGVKNGASADVPIAPGPHSVRFVSKWLGTNGSCSRRLIVNLPPGGRAKYRVSFHTVDLNNELRLEEMPS